MVCALQKSYFKTGKVQGEHLCRNPVLETLPCIFIKIGLRRWHFPRNVPTFFDQAISQNTFGKDAHLFTLIFFYKQLASGALKVTYTSKVFMAQSCWHFPRNVPTFFDQAISQNTFGKDVHLFTLIFFYKQLASGLSSQSYLYFQGFYGSKLLDGCLVVWPSNLCLRGILQFSGFKTDIYNQWFWNIPRNAFVTAEFWCIVGLKAILRLLLRKNSTFL